MYRACIAVVDASRARLFTFQRSSEVEGVHEELTEQRDLVNPARRRRSADLFSDTRPGVARTAGVQYGLDDHRDDSIAHMDSEFSRAIVGELADMVRAARADRLIVCASPHMLGDLRDAGDELRRAVAVIDEVPRDLVKLTPTQLRARLASYGILPAVSARPS